MRIQIIKPGLLSTLQDNGRRGYLAHGVPFSGAMDSLAARLANMAVGNDEKAAVVEFTYAGAELKAETDLLIAYAGEGAYLQAANRVLPTARPVFIPAGTLLKLAYNAAGSRICLAVAGGWDVPDVLGSKSTCLTAGFGGFKGRALRSGDRLFNAPQQSATMDRMLNMLKGERLNYPAWGMAAQQFLPASKKTIRVVPGREFTWFQGGSLVNFLSTPYTLNVQSNRMGYRLKGAPVLRSVQRELLSTAIVPGTIQVMGDGSLVLLMADSQTTGGYPRIAQVAAVDMPLCGQLKPGDRIRFSEVSRQEAEMLYLEREMLLGKLATAVASRF